MFLGGNYAPLTLVAEDYQRLQYVVANTFLFSRETCPLCIVVANAISDYKVVVDTVFNDHKVVADTFLTKKLHVASDEYRRPQSGRR